MPELALDDQQRDALARHLHSMSMAELMRREPPSHLRASGGVMKLHRTPAGAHGRPRVGPRRMQNNARTGSEERG